MILTNFVNCAIVPRSACVTGPPRYRTLGIFAHDRFASSPYQAISNTTFRPPDITSDRIAPGHMRRLPNIVAHSELRPLMPVSNKYADLTSSLPVRSGTLEVRLRGRAARSSLDVCHRQAAVLVRHHPCHGLTSASRFLGVFSDLVERIIFVLIVGSIGI